MSKRLQSTSKTFSIFTKKKSTSPTNMDNDAHNSITKKSPGSSKSVSKKPVSGFGFLSLEQSMNDKTLQVYKNDEFVCIRDKYPKSRIHLLLIPLPEASNGIKLTKVEQVLQMPTAIQFLKNIRDLALEIIKSSVIKSKETYPQLNDIKIGFHAVQSMAPLHMHIMTKDFQSPSLKNKKHWNSFNTEYFIELDQMITHLEINKDTDYFKGDMFNLRDRAKLDEFLKMDLKCHKCMKSMKNMPELKKHLETHET